MWKEVWTLFKKDITLEWRQRYSINGILVYVIATVFVSYLSFRIISPAAWNALFWIILLFSAVTATAKSFMAESRGRQLYYYSLASPQSIILAKIIYNVLFLWLLAILSIVFYTLWLGNPVEDFTYFLITVLLGCTGFACAFTLLSGIASKTINGSMLMPVLCLPLIIPLLLVLIRASKTAMDGLDRTLLTDDFIVLVSLDGIFVILSWVLFPFVWKD